MYRQGRIQDIVKVGVQNINVSYDELNVRPAKLVENWQLGAMGAL